MSDTNNSILPAYLDPGSFGFWVWFFQKQMHEHYNNKILKFKPPPITGCHEQEWVEFVKALQNEWSIDADGGMGPQFRAEYKKRSGYSLYILGQYISAPTVWFGPKSKDVGQVVLARHIDNTDLRTAALSTGRSITFLPVGERIHRSGGDGGTNLTKDGYHAIRRIGEQLKVGAKIVIEGGDERIVLETLADWSVLDRKATLTGVVQNEGLILGYGQWAALIPYLPSDLIVVVC